MGRPGPACCSRLQQPALRNRLGQGRTLNVASALGQRATGEAVTAEAATPDVSGAVRVEPLDVIMKRHIELALRETRGRVEGPYGAARLLRINPHTLRARMRKLKVDWQQFRQA